MKILTFNFFFTVFCVIGCSIQSINLCIWYFNYKTRTNVQVIVEQYFKLPNLALCIRFNDIVNRTLWHEYGFNDSDEAYGYETELSLPTVKQIFDLTPPVEQLVGSCYLRNTTMALYFEAKAKKCNDYFNMTKFLFRMYMCYSMQSNDERLFQFESITRDIEETNILYGIYFNTNSSLNRTQTILPIVYSRNEGVIPMISRDYAKSLTTRQMERFPRRIKYNDFFVHYRNFRIQKLASPYDTLCRTDRIQCKDKCLVDKLKKVDRHPSSVNTVDTQVNLKPISLMDKGNDTIISWNNEADEYCSKLCHGNNCYTEYSVTNIVPRLTLPLKDRYFFEVDMADIPTISVISLPTLLFVEFVIYLTSIFGWWLGFSVMSINPIKLYNSRGVKHANQKSVDRLKKRIWTLESKLNTHFLLNQSIN